MDRRGPERVRIAKRAAEKLSFIYVDTGAMYRAIALGLLRSNTDIADEAALNARLAEISVEISYEGGVQQVYLNGENVSNLIRTEEVSDMTSRSSAIAQVRAKLTDLQRDLAARENVLMDGRDIGTTILPHAQLKIYLTASVEVRALRRYKEYLAKGQKGPDTCRGGKGCRKQRLSRYAPGCLAALPGRRCGLPGFI